MNAVLRLELAQRARGVAWWVLLSIWFVLIAGVTLLIWWVSRVNTESRPSAWLYSTITFFVLLLATLVGPALSGNAINGDRNEGLLATVQVTQVTGAQIVWGKFFAAFFSSVVFLLAAAPAMVFAAYVGHVGWQTLVISIVALLVEMAVISAFGVGLSGVMQRPLFSIVTTYLLVALLSLGTLIAFGIATSLTVTHKETQVIQVDPTQSSTGDGSTTDGSTSTVVCLPATTEDRQYPRADYWWWLLSSNPYVVLSDVTPTTLDAQGNPDNVFTMIKYGVRQLQRTPVMPDVENYCNPALDESANPPTASQVIDEGIPSWYVGLGTHVLIAFALMIGAIGKTQTPIRRLPKGQRIA